MVFVVGRPSWRNESTDCDCGSIAAAVDTDDEPLAAVSVGRICCFLQVSWVRCRVCSGGVWDCARHRSREREKICPEMGLNGG